MLILKVKGAEDRFVVLYQRDKSEYLAFSQYFEDTHFFDRGVAGCLA
jgi:hypothetical protein